jgi:hypothetical protein
MDESAKVVTRGWVDLLIGMIVLAGALVALGFPVYLETYDLLRCPNQLWQRLLQSIAAGDNR